MEQGLMAAGIGIIIGVMSYTYGFSRGKSTGVESGILTGSLMVYYYLSKHNIIGIHTDAHNKSMATVYGKSNSVIINATEPNWADLSKTSNVNTMGDKNE